ncbi:MAG TPA: hypothetical protein VIH24_02885 [Candidatus Limnocylindria bacterium]|jgi:hypothetical protein
MLIPNHPDEERLSALASRDDEAIADTALVTHVTSCIRCTGLIDELGALRASLAELPDIAPHRPLRLLPEVAAKEPDRLGTWARRVFGPLMAIGAAFALVGMVGTVAPSLGGLPASAGGQERDVASIAAGAENGLEEPEYAAGGLSSDTARPATQNGEDDDGVASVPDEVELVTTDPERSPWPMVLFTGVALLIGAALLRWILVPRAG